MANLIESNEIFFTPFEPKQTNRFIMQIEGIPTFMIKKTGFPSVSQNAVTMDHINVQRHVKGKTTWDTVGIELYDPISPSGAQTAIEWLRLCHESVTGRDGYSDFYKKDITILVLGPLGDVVSEWTLKGAFPTAISFGDGDFTSDGPVSISITLQIDYAILQF